MAAPPALRGRYVILRPLAAGGQCRVSLARDEADGGRTVVIKQFVPRWDEVDSQKEEVALFRQEARILSTVRHASLPSLVDAFEETDGHYVVEEHVGDLDLETLLRRRPHGLDEVEVAWLGHRLLDLLATFHGCTPPLLARDIKPSNITCCVDGDDVMRRDVPVWFIDLTIAQEYHPPRGDAVTMGSPGFAPPEQYHGRTQPRSDLYALGMTMFAALTGHSPVQSPFRLPPLALLRDDVADAWAPFFARACALEPSARFTSAAQMRESLEGIVPERACEGSLAAPRRASGRGRRWPSRRSVALVLAFAALALVIALALTR